MNEFWRGILLQLIEVVIVVATPVLLLLLRKGIKVLERKLDIDFDDQQEAQLEAIFDQSIAYARESGRAALKAGDSRLGGDVKKDIALGYVRAALYEKGRPVPAPAALEHRLEARLNMHRADGDRDIPIRKPE